MIKSTRVLLTSEAAYEARRWALIFDDISKRPGLERAQAEAILCRAQSQTGATDERKRELRKRVEDRFGVSEPVRPPLLALVAQPERGQQRLFGEADADRTPEPEAPSTQKVRENLKTTKKASKVPARLPARKKRKHIEPTRVVQSAESQFQHLVLRMGFDAAQAALDDLKRRYGVG